MIIREADWLAPFLRVPFTPSSLRGNEFRTEGKTVVIINKLLFEFVKCSY